MADTDLFLQLDQQKRRSPTPPEPAGAAVPKTQASQPARPSKPADRGAVQQARDSKLKRESKQKVIPVGKKDTSQEGRKFTSKLVSTSQDPSVNKVGYYFTRREIDQLDTLWTRLKPLMRDRYNRKVSKNDIVRACIAIGVADWEENQLASELLHLLTGREVEK